MARKTLQTEKAAVTGGPYSQAVIHGGLVYLSGQVAMDPQTNQPRLGDIRQETEVVMQNIGILLAEAGSSLERVLKVTVYLGSMEDYPAFNQVYRHYFPQDPPARTCVAVAGLPLGVKVEMDLVAAI